MTLIGGSRLLDSASTPWRSVSRRLPAASASEPDCRSGWPRAAGTVSAMEQTLPGFDRITVDPAKLGGKPCIRSYRFSVEHLLELVAADWTVDEIRAEFSFIEPDDVRQVLKHAAALARRDLYPPQADSG